MRRSILVFAAVAISALISSGRATAQQPAPDGAKTLAATLGVYVFPTQQQTREVQSSDEAACYQWAVDATGLDPFLIQKQNQAAQQQAAAEQQAAKQAGKGAGARGALVGAAAGALIGEIASDDAGKGAAAGAVAGGAVGLAKRRQAQKQAESQAQAKAASAQALSDEQMTGFRKAFSVCLEAKRYLVKF